MWGGAALCTGERTPALGGLDKAFPLCFVGAGAYLGMYLLSTQVCFFSGMWNLTPAIQRLGGSPRGGGALGVVDKGALGLRGGPGAASLSWGLGCLHSGWLVSLWVSAVALAL